MTTMSHVQGEGPPVQAVGRSLHPPAATNAEFEALYATNFNRLVMQLYAYTDDLSLAQDLVQEAFARAVPRWDRLSGYQDPVAWVRRVAWNLATSRWRQLRRFNAFAGRQREEYAPEPSPTRVLVPSALGELPREQRRAMIMYYLADMSVGEIAEHERVPAGTVKSWLYRARTSLAVRLSDHGKEQCHG